MSGHGHHEAAWQFDAMRWHDRVYADVHSEQGRAAAREHRVSPWLINQAAALIAGDVARGQDVVSLADAMRRAPTWGTEGRPISAQQARRVAAFVAARGHIAAFLAARGHIERTGDRDLIRPIGVRADELPLA